MTDHTHQGDAPEELSAASEASQEPRPRPKRSRASVWALGGVLFGSSLLLGLFTSFVIEQSRPADHVLGRIRFEETSLAGLNAQGVQAALAPHRERLQKRKLSFRFEEKPELVLSAEELGVDLDVEEITARAIALGRSRSLPREFGFFLTRLFAPHVLLLEPKIDEDKLSARVDKLQAQLAPRTTRETRIFFDKKLQLEFPEPWRAIDREQLAQLLPSLFLAPGEETHLLPSHLEEPPISKEEAEARLDDAKRLLSGKITLFTETDAHHVELTPRLLGRALSSRITGEEEKTLELVLDLEILKPAFAQLREELEHPARPASFHVDNKQHVSVVPSEIGKLLDEPRLLTEIFEASARPDRRGALHFVESTPEGLTTKEAESLGITGLVTSFTTHHPCCEPRVKNIHAVAAQIDGAVVRPGENFSLNEFLGPRTFQAGFLEAPTIVGGKMKPTVGGGISQFATTIFNAVLNGGYEIVQRQPHSFYFSRYPEGHEATVSFPSPDFIFKNDTASGLLIKTQYSGTFIRVLLYGNNEGRRVERKLSRRFALTEPPVEYVPNDELSPEKPKITYRGQQGWSVFATRIVHYADGRKLEQNREVTYNPRPQVVEVHSCMIPKGFPDYTGKDCPEPPEEEEEQATENGEEVQPILSEQN